MSNHEYPYTGKDGIRWRFEKGRPISELADRVMAELGSDVQHVVSMPQLDRRDLETENVIRQVTRLAYEQGYKPGSDVEKEKFGIWAAGFIQGYLARKQEKL